MQAHLSSAPSSDDQTHTRRCACLPSNPRTAAFWLSWMAVELIASLLFTLLLIAFGAMFQFEFFLRNSFALVFFLFFLFQCSMVSVAFLLSSKRGWDSVRGGGRPPPPPPSSAAFVSKSATAINLGFVVFLVGWVIQSAVVFGFPYTPNNIKNTALVVIFTLMPWAVLSKASGGWAPSVATAAVRRPPCMPRFSVHER